MPYDISGNYVSDEAARRGGGLVPNYLNGGVGSDAAYTPYNTTPPTYTNGHHYAGTNVPMSDQAYAELTAGGNPLATDRNVLGGGAYGIRNWLHDHPVGTIATFIAAAAGGAALAGGSGAAGGGGAAAAGEGAGGVAGGTGGVGGGVGAGVGGGAGASALGNSLPEIVVSANAPAAGLTAGQVASGIGAGAGGLGSALPSGGTTPYQSNYNGWNNTTDWTGSVGNTELGAPYGGAGPNIAGGAGASGGGSGMGWGDWVNLAGQVAGSYFQGQGARDAARAAAAGDAAAIAEQRREFDTVMGLQAPYQQLGTNAIGQIGRLYGYNTGANGGAGAPDMSGFFTSPDYNFRRDEGTRGIENTFSARGGAASGNALRALADYNSNLAAGEYGNYYNRLAGQAGIGQTATNAGSTAALSTGNNVSNYLSNQGANRASGIEGSTNALTGGISDLLAWYNRKYGGGG